jgi:uncharacterized protein (TIGR02588 family)
MAQAKRNAKRRDADSRKGKTPLLEWVLGAVGALLLASGLAFLIHEGLTNDDGPGEVTAEVIEIAAAGDAFVVRYTLHNAGRETLTNLQMIARVWDGEREIETARALIDHLPGQSVQEGGFYLRNDPRRYRLDIRPEGYQSP